jgi:hypothetical protein
VKYDSVEFRVLSLDIPLAMIIPACRISPHRLPLPLDMGSIAPIRARVPQTLAVRQHERQMNRNLRAGSVRLW